MKPFLAALAVSISFAGGGGEGDPLKNRAVLVGASPANTQVDVKAVRPGSIPARQQPVPQGAVTAPLSRAAGTRGENPGRKWPLIGRVQTASLVALALADYDSTQRGLARGGYEANPVLSCGGSLCGGRYAAINAAMVAGTYALSRYVVPKLPPRSRRITNIMIFGMIGGRGYIVARNYHRAGRLQ